MEQEQSGVKSKQPAYLSFFLKDNENSLGDSTHHAREEI